jgi:hypothetical protein
MEVLHGTAGHLLFPPGPLDSLPWPYLWCRRSTYYHLLSHLRAAAAEAEGIRRGPFFGPAMAHWNLGASTACGALPACAGPQLLVAGAGAGAGVPVLHRTGYVRRAGDSLVAPVAPLVAADVRLAFCQAVVLPAGDPCPLAWTKYT